MKIKAKILAQHFSDGKNKALIDVNSTDGKITVTGRLIIESVDPLPSIKKDLTIDIPEK